MLRFLHLSLLIEPSTTLVFRWKLAKLSYLLLNPIYTTAVMLHSNSVILVSISNGKVIYCHYFCFLTFPTFDIRMPLITVLIHVVNDGEILRKYLLTSQNCIFFALITCQNSQHNFTRVYN